MQKYVEIFEERSESLKNIFNITRNLDNSFMGWDNYKKSNSIKLLENIEKDKNFDCQDKFKEHYEFNKSTLIFEGLFEKNISFKDNIQLHVLEKLKVFYLYDLIYKIEI